ncbi:hypothetical protein A3A09_02320 [Candidatus Nomurabacteria bacterium RIFCSPLOWO2_01_FULL_42_20]|uniref:Phage holin family protein n=1 Tax=Candidatus Nomurabacteria bacterium RIFCSPHIGHO2_01_FULL_42_16 TaxID=1801743 RepID=A0A1F6VJM2_9BACT|nr:MAG: hypothetical protein A2824_01470 [Candidatus Nomurabacteria bacterium RIFCSPHIGHO2_01_FULL_42_16]OGI92115.1 MAG: hypothetical protein A3A09_02320 [Candidatus Nomurabacteria bacterium RIFCSPLOWO2_01_FULL_42_20]
MRIILQWLILSGAVYGLGYFLPGINVAPWWVAAIVGAILVFINIIVRPILKILTLPLNLITFGLFSVALNVLFFWFPSTIIDGFDVITWKDAIIGAIIISLINWIFDKVRK